MRYAARHPNQSDLEWLELTLQADQASIGAKAVVLRLAIEFYSVPADIPRSLVFPETRGRLALLIR